MFTEVHQRALFSNIPPKMHFQIYNSYNTATIHYSSNYKKIIKIVFTQILRLKL